MECSCDSMCKEAGSCTCIFIVSTGYCKCECGPPIVLPAEDRPSASRGCDEKQAADEKAAPSKPVALDEPINLSARDAELGEVASLIAGVTRTEVLIPATELRKPITIELEDVRLGDAIDRLNLVPAKPLRR